jgi:hypothetical protein
MNPEHILLGYLREPVRTGKREAAEQRFRDTSRDPSGASRRFHPHTALRLGIHLDQAKLAWCAETLNLLAARAAGRQPRGA